MIAFRFCGGESRGMDCRFRNEGPIPADGVRGASSPDPVQPLMDPGRDANGQIFVRPLLIMEGNSRLPVGIGNEDFEVEGSRNGLIADHARDETVLADSSEDACVHTRTR
jgi:hypothetical protein